MKKNSFIGYSIAIVSGLIMIASAFLSLTMVSETGSLVQGQSLFEALKNLGSIDSTLYTVSIIMYLIGVGFACVELICGIIGMIMSANDKYSKVLLLIERVISVLAFLCVVISLCVLGGYLAGIEATGYNFTGFGILLAVLGSLLLVDGFFIVRTKKIEKN